MGTTLLVVAYGFVIMHVLGINIGTVDFLRFPNETLSHDSEIAICS
jgi:hypothetical protein